MDVLHLHQHHATPEGAGGHRFCELARNLLRQGHTGQGARARQPAEGSFARELLAARFCGALEDAVRAHGGIAAPGTPAAMTGDPAAKWESPVR